MRPKNRISVDLTSPIHYDYSSMGKALNSVLYNNSNLLNLIEFTGCPHTGGQHSLRIIGSEKDVLSWLDLFVGEYPNTTNEINMIKQTILDNQDTWQFWLARMKRDFTINGITLSRNWFWSWMDNFDPFFPCPITYDAFLAVINTLDVTDAKNNELFEACSDVRITETKWDETDEGYEYWYRMHLIIFKTFREKLLSGYMDGTQSVINFVHKNNAKELTCSEFYKFVK